MPVLRNPRHEKFSQLVASGIKPANAYITLGYSGNGAPQSAANLLKRADVRERIAEILSVAAQSVAEEIAFDHKRVLHRLDVLSHKAEELKQIAAAIRAEELIGKERGMFIDRTDNMNRNMSIEELLDAQPKDELEAALARAKAERQRQIEEQAAEPGRPVN